ncbi:Ppx/GppA phosphatase family protein [Actinopolyspora biskrensis]|uniref:Ppx/GppA phosphatase family protein n=1 Tax=Actinopolyspora biskrensis TaxID=1470178 RepID=UPI0015CEDA3E
MRLGVLDVGSNTVHLLVVDAYRGAHPTPMTSEKTVLRLSERIDASGTLSEPAVAELTSSVEAARKSALELGCAELVGFATSAIRRADNATAVLERVRERTGVELRVLSGVDEARLTFLAARRWYGWSAGNLLVLDIGGGSLEMALGVDEQPDTAVSLPLGAGHVGRVWSAEDPPRRAEVERLREWIDDQLAEAARRFREFDHPDKVVATSKTFRSLARLSGAAAASAGPRVRRTLTSAALNQLLAFVTRISTADLASLDGVSSARAHQLASGGLVAEGVLRALGLSEVEICPWALREGVILRRLDRADVADGPEDGLSAPSTIAGDDTG